MRLIITSLIAVSVISGCSKSATAKKDIVPPTITLVAPLANQNFTAGQAIQISGNIADDKYIAEIHIHVINTNTGALLIDVHLYPGSSFTTFNQSINATTGTNYKIQIIAKDKAVNEAISSVEVTCN